MDKNRVNKFNTTALAYMGDAIYEVYIRERAMESGAVYVKELHKVSIQYANAMNQAKAMKKMFETLTEEEQKLVKRARNRKVATKAKNADIISYKWATALEALIGYMYLSGDEKRMDEIIKQAMEVIDEQSR